MANRDGVPYHPRMTEFHLEVNGTPQRVEVEADTPLLYVLRNALGLHDPRFGCGLAQCGACTVHLDGEPVPSCVIPIAAAAGKKVTTLGGLGARVGGVGGGSVGADVLHPIQQAYIDEQVPQCGYCINGWIMTAAALLDRTPKPSDAQIRAALSGLKCRCGTQLAILRAVKRAATAMS